MMDKDKFERLNFLSEKALQNNATNDELKEFNKLHKEWTEPQEFNLFGDYIQEH